MESINWNTIYGIAGILGSIIGIIGIVLAIYYANRKKRNSQLKYIPGEFFNVYNLLPSKFDNFKVEYSGASITEKMFFINGKLVVDGDIKTEGNEVSIKLPDGWKWIDTSKESSHPAVNPKFEKDTEIPNKAILTFNKLRREDHIIISGIIEGDQLSDDLHKKIRFSHRIDDTDDVKVENPVKLQQLITMSMGVLGLLASIISIYSFVSSSDPSRSHRREEMYKGFAEIVTEQWEVISLSIISALIASLLLFIIQRFIKNK